MIKFHCTHCNQRLSAPDNFANKKLRCPKCKYTVLVPSQTQQSEAQSQSIIKFRCPGCNQKIGVPVKYAGKKVRCAKCKHTLQVPHTKPPVAQPQPATAALKDASGQDEIGFGNVFDDNVALQLLAAEANAPETETLHLKPQEPPTPFDRSAESALYNRATLTQTDSE